MQAREAAHILQHTSPELCHPTCQEGEVENLRVSSECGEVTTVTTLPSIVGCVGQGCPCVGDIILLASIRVTKG